MGIFGNIKSNVAKRRKYHAESRKLYGRASEEERANEIDIAAQDEYVSARERGMSQKQAKKYAEASRRQMKRKLHKIS